MLRIAICDDDLFIRNQLTSIVQKVNNNSFNNIEFMVFQDGEDLYQTLLHKERFDLVILDIKMEKMDGLKLGNLIREKLKLDELSIIYVSSEKDYAMDLFKVRPFNFLIKPLDEKEVIGSINKAIGLLSKGLEPFEFKIGTNKHRIPIKDILYFEGRGRKVSMTTLQGSYEFYDKISNIHSILENYDFITIHKSYLINYNHISRISYDEVCMNDGAVLVISQNYRSSIRAKHLARGEK